MRLDGDLSQQDLRAILDGYNLGRWRRCTYIERGYVNEKWLLESEKGSFLLKRRRASLREPSLVQGHHALVQHLRGAGFPAPALVRNTRGEPYLLQAGEIYELQKYVTGDPFDASEPAHLSAAACMLGSYHNAVRGFDHQALHRPQERYGAVALARAVQGLLPAWRASRIAELNRLVCELDEQVHELDARYLEFGRLPEVVIHGDYHGGNLIFQEGNVAAVVDYDLAHWAARAMEVAESIIAFCTDPGWELLHIVYPGALDLEAVDRFVTAYQAVAPMSEAEVRALPDMIRTIWLCASLEPPLEPPLSRGPASLALPELLALAKWAQQHASELVAICTSAAQQGTAGWRHRCVP